MKKMKAYMVVVLAVSAFLLSTVNAWAVSEEAQRHFDRGMAAVEMAKSPDDYAAAIKEFEQAIRFAPDWPDVYYNLGMVQEKAGQYRDAITSLKQYLRLAPNASDAEPVKSLVNKLEYKQELLITKGAESQQRDIRFEGEWIISDYQEGGNRTYRLDGDIVKISKNNNIYYVEGPNDWFFLKTQKFRAERDDLLVGRYRPNLDDLTQMFPSVSENSRGQAVGKIVLAGTLSMQRNDIIIVEYNYWQIGHSGGKFIVKENPGWYSFVLTRKKGSADINAKNKDGNTPLLYAILNDSTETAEQLIAQGADINAKNKDGYTPLHYAVSGNSKEMAELLIAKGADIDAKEKNGYTPLHYAVSGNSKEMAELLIAKGADINAKDKDGNTPLLYAVLMKHKEMEELLRRHGAR